MRQVMLLTATVGCVLVALLCGKRPDNDWSSALLSVSFAGLAGVFFAAAMT